MSEMLPRFSRILLLIEWEDILLMEYQVDLISSKTVGIMTVIIIFDK